MFSSKKRKSIFLTLFLLLSVITVTIIFSSGIISAASPVNNGVYKIVNRNSGLVLDVQDGSFEDGVNVQQWEDNGYDCQKWQLEETDSGYYHYMECI
jgi:hypothetical protein